MAYEPKPNKGLKTCLLGCGIVLLLGLAGLAWLTKFALNSSRATLDTANAFVDTALAGDDGTAYAMLYEVQRQQTSPALFSEHWDAARNVVGGSPKAEIAGQPAPDFQSGLVTLQYSVTGGSGTVMVEIDVNPGEKPPTVVNYRITGLPAGQANQAPVDATAPSPAGPADAGK